MQGINEIENSNKNIDISVQLFEKELNNILPGETIRTWFNNMKFTAKDGVIVIKSDNKYELDWVKAKYSQILCNLAKEIGAENGVIFEKYNKVNESAMLENIQVIKKVENHAHFIEDQSNKIALSTVKYIIENQENSVIHGKVLHIFGAEASGKTSLIKYLQNKIGAENCVFFSAIEFVNHYSTSVRKKLLDEFRSGVLSKKFLIIDDVHLLSSQKGTIAEFGRLVSIFCDSNRVVITSSNKPIEFMPEDITAKVKGLNYAMSIGLDVPSLKLKQEIAQYHIQQCELKSDLLSAAFIKKSNLRDIVANIARAKIFKHSKNLDLFYDANHLEEASNCKSGDIIAFVTSHFEIEHSDLFGRGGGQNTSLARYITMYLLRKHTNMTMQQIAAKLKLKSHANVSKSIQMVKENKNIDISNILISIEKKLVIK